MWGFGQQKKDQHKTIGNIGKLGYHHTYLIIVLHIRMHRHHCYIFIGLNGIVVVPSMPFLIQ